MEVVREGVGVRGGVSVGVVECVADSLGSVVLDAEGTYVAVDDWLCEINWLKDVDVLGDCALTVAVASGVHVAVVDWLAEGTVEAVREGRYDAVDDSSDESDLLRDCVDVIEHGTIRSPTPIRTPFSTFRSPVAASALALVDAFHPTAVPDTTTTSVASAALSPSSLQDTVTLNGGIACGRCDAHRRDSAQAASSLPRIISGRLGTASSRFKDTNACSWASVAAS
jgi:hypothetical protein